MRDFDPSFRKVASAAMMRRSLAAVLFLVAAALAAAESTGTITAAKAAADDGTVVSSRPGGHAFSGWPGASIRSAGDGVSAAVTHHSARSCSCRARSLGSTHRSAICQWPFCEKMLLRRETLDGFYVHVAFRGRGLS